MIHRFKVLEVYPNGLTRETGKTIDMDDDEYRDLHYYRNTIVGKIFNRYEFKSYIDSYKVSAKDSMRTISVTYNYYNAETGLYGDKETWILEKLESEVEIAEE